MFQIGGCAREILPVIALSRATRAALDTGDVFSRGNGTHVAVASLAFGIPRQPRDSLALRSFDQAPFDFAQDRQAPAWKQNRLRKPVRSPG